LAKEEAELALQRFDSILARQPAHAEALLRKGSALERLQRNEEAIACYDRAIAADGTLTMAYLYKGGLFNRMERFTEAMDCYEKALKIQEGRATT
jgi:tetratricopeptide (TPR) repeat protein